MPVTLITALGPRCPGEPGVLTCSNLQLSMYDIKYLKLCQVVSDEDVNIVHVQQEMIFSINECRSIRSGNNCKVIQNAGTQRSVESVFVGFLMMTSR